MSSPSDEVRADPFFGVVRRRHPDVDIVLLPPDQESEDVVDAAGGAPVDPPLLDDAGAAEDELRREVEALWQTMLGETTADVSSRWTPPRRSPRLIVTGAHPHVGAVDAAAALARAERQLRADGWHVLVPETGMPRVLASRGTTETEQPADELLAVHVPGTGRFAVEWRRGPWRTLADGTERR